MSGNNINKFGQAQVVYGEDGRIIGLYDPELDAVVDIEGGGPGSPADIFIKDGDDVVGLRNPATLEEFTLPVDTVSPPPDIFIKDIDDVVIGLVNPATGEQVLLDESGGPVPSPNIFLLDEDDEVVGLVNPSNGAEYTLPTQVVVPPPPDIFIKDENGNVVGLINPFNGEQVSLNTAAIGVDEFEEVVDPETFSVPTRLYSDRLTVGGKIFKKVFAGGQPDVFMYALEQAASITADNINITGLNNSSIATKTVGSLKAPGDSLRWSPQSKITITVNANAPLDGHTISIGPSAIRTGSAHLIHKLIANGTGNTAIFELILEPVWSCKAKLVEVTEATKPTTYPNPTSLLWDLNMVGNVVLPIYFKFNGTAQGVPTVTVTSIEAKIDIQPPPQFRYNPALTYRKASEHPYPATDPFNRPITDRVVIRKPVFAVNWSSSGSSTGGTINASGTAGSDVVTIPSGTAKIKVGMYPSILGVYGTADADVAPATYGNTYAKKTQDTFGSTNFVIEIINGTQVRMRNPLLLNLSERGKEAWGEIHGLGFFESPETLNIRQGFETDSVRINLFTGTIKTSNKAIGYPDGIPIYRVAPSDPLRTWNITQVNSPNPWFFDDSTATPFASGELYGGPIQMKTPAAITRANIGTVSSNVDRNVIILTDDGKYAIELYYIDHNTTTNIYSAARAVIYDLTDLSNFPVHNRPEYSSSGLSTGTRAWGGGLLNGIVRKHEIDRCTDTGNISADITKAMNAIPHALAMVLSGAQLKSHNYCPDFTVQGTKVTMKGYRNQFDKWKPGIKTAGSGYEVGDVVYALGGTFITELRLAVTAVNGTGGITDWFVTQTGQYISLPSDGNNITTKTSGGGVGAVITVTNIPGDVTQTTLAAAFPNLAKPQLYTYPATVCDDGWSANYSGVIPMGAMFTVDPDWDLVAEWTARRTTAPTALSSSYELLAIYAALQRYGAFNLDITIDTHLVVVMERSIVGSQLQRITGDTGSFTMPNLNNIKNRLYYVENCTPQGAGVAGAYKVPLSNDIYPVAN
jgi:hypothetical protein